MGTSQTRCALRTIFPGTLRMGIGIYNGNRVSDPRLPWEFLATRARVASHERRHSRV